MDGKTAGKGAIASLLVSHCGGMLDIVSLPFWIGALGGHYGFTPAMAGALVTLFLVGEVAASMSLSRVFERIPHRAVATGGFAIAAVLFAAASVTTLFVPLALLHGAAGLAVGTALATAHGAMGRSGNPHRLFGMANAALGFLGIVMLGALPQVIQASGGQTIFIAFALISITAAAVNAVMFPRLEARAKPAKPGPRGFSPQVWALIIGIGFMTLTNAMVFSFIELIGQARHFGSSGVTLTFIALGLTNFLLIPPLAILLQKRLRADDVLRLGPAVQAVLALTITMSSAFMPWSAAVVLYTGVMIFSHNFAFGMLSKLEPSGRAASATPAMIMTGAALGPLIGGLLGEGFGYPALGLAALVFAGCAIGSFARLRRISPAPGVLPV